MTLTEATLALVKDHCYGRHERSHPQCPVCAQRTQPEWIKRMQTEGLPAKEMTS